MDDFNAAKSAVARFAWQALYLHVEATKTAGLTMANGRQATNKRLKMSERAQQQMDLHFPGVDPRILWRRKNNDGYTTVPRTLPIVMQAIDMACNGQPAGHVLFSLWARSPDNPLVVVENPTTFAAEAGYQGERKVDTWRRRMKSLRDLGMIATKPGPSGEFHYVLLLNPNTAVEWMKTHGKVQDEVYGRFIDRLAEVGAYGDIVGIREFWTEQAAAAATASSPSSTSSDAVAASAGAEAASE
ncbi:hypothetical protein [Paracoccus yeei]|nr:hypothetical protein [Paracoccus yeei]